MASLSEQQSGIENGGGYPARWRLFALRRHLAWILLIGWVPVCAGLFLLSRHVVHLPLTALAIMSAWLIAALGAVYWAGQFRCPRCRRRYAALGDHGGHNLTRGFFNPACTNCQLKKFEL